MHRHRRKGSRKFAMIAVLAFTLFAFVSLLWLSTMYKVYVVHTGSMDPTIPSGSAVVVRMHHYEVGQPVTFTINGTIVTHRLIRIDSDGGIVTKGDANSSADPWQTVTTSNIVGGVVAAPRYLGYALVYLRQPTGLFSVLLLVLCLWQTDGIVRALTARPTASGADDSEEVPQDALTSF